MRTQSQFINIPCSENDSVEGSSETCPYDGKKFVWLRCTFPLHFVLAAIELIICQSLRSVASLAIGLLTFRASYIVDSFKDLISIPIQLVSLPLITILVCVNPQDGLKALKTFINIAGGKLQERETKGLRFAYYRAVTGFVRGIFGTPIVIVTQTTRLFSLLLVGNLEKTSEKIKTLLNYLASALLLPFLGCTTIWSKKAMIYIHKVQQVKFNLLDYLG